MKNEPAFPTKINTEHFSHPSTIYKTGMTLRDYFAAKAMQGLITQFAHGFEPDTVDGFSTISYQVADSMMEARQA